MIHARTLDVLGTMLILKHEHDLIAQHPAELTPQIATPQLSQLAQHRAIALGGTASAAGGVALGLAGAAAAGVTTVGTESMSALYLSTVIASAPPATTSAGVTAATIFGASAPAIITGNGSVVFAAGGGTMSALTAYYTIQTPYGPTTQATTPQAYTALLQAHSGATLYRLGGTGFQEVVNQQSIVNAQYWSLTNPLITPNYANQMGLPPNLTQPGSVPWIMTGTLKPGQPAIVQPASPLGQNQGGALNLITNPGAVRINYFGTLNQ